MVNFVELVVVKDLWGLAALYAGVWEFLALWVVLGAEICVRTVVGV